MLATCMPFLYIVNLKYNSSWVPHRKSKNLQTSQPVQQARQMQCQTGAQKSKQLPNGSQGLPYWRWETGAWFQVHEVLHRLPSWYPWKWKSNRAISCNPLTPDMPRQIHLYPGITKKSAYAVFQWLQKQGLQNTDLTPVPRDIPFWYDPFSLRQDSGRHTVRLHFR